VKILGAILAGGQSRRFGSDKAEALVDGKALLDHVADALRCQTGQLVVAGRDWPGMVSVPDLPEAGLGPLGGLAGALDYARAFGFDAILSSGCDVLGLPPDLTDHLGPGPAILDEIPIVGLWPAAFHDTLLLWLADYGNRSVYRFADHVGARRIKTPHCILNINFPTDLGIRVSDKPGRN
jgi:molybdenum cofactor guanylyltransferase